MTNTISGLAAVLGARVRYGLVAFVLTALTQLSSAANGTLPMWEIRDGAGKGAVYLLGSVHVCRPDCLQFPPTVMTRFERSSALALELDPSRPELMEKMRESASLPPGKTLSSMLTPAQNARLQKVLASLGLPPQVLEPIRPMMAAATLSVLAAQTRGFTAQYGVDAWFQQRAQRAGKPVRELETMERQMAALTSASPSEEVTGLMDTLALIESRRAGPYFDELIGAWRVGDLAAISRLMKEGLGTSGTLETELLGKRNAEMADKIAAWLARGDEVFVVIGAAHIAGPDNVAELLARKRYTIRQLREGD